MGVERHKLQDCEPGDFVLCGGEFKGETKLLVRRAITPEKWETDPPAPTPDMEGPVLFFERVWAESGGVFTAWRRVK